MFCLYIVEEGRDSKKCGGGRNQTKHPITPGITHISTKSHPQGKLQVIPKRYRDISCGLLCRKT